MRFKTNYIDPEISSFIQIQEIDKKRIAAEIHDTSLQTLAHLTHQLELASLYVDVDINKAKLEIADINSKVKDVIEELRQMIHSFRPMSFDDLTLREAIEESIILVNNKSSINYNFDIEDIDIDDDIQKLELFRTIQECVANCEKHSKASNIWVRLFIKNNELHVIVDDDGIGFDVDNVINKDGYHFGIKIMRDRIERLGGKIEYNTSPGNSTKISIVIPIEE